jgi:hypothetical protein
VEKVSPTLKQFRDEPGADNNERSFVINYFSSKRAPLSKHAQDAASLGCIEQKLDNADPSIWEKTGNREPHNQFGIDDATSWQESKHPRGQPGNAGQFGKGGGGAKQESGAKPEQSPLL